MPSSAWTDVDSATTTTTTAAAAPPVMFALKRARSDDEDDDGSDSDTTSHTMTTAALPLCVSSSSSACARKACVDNGNSNNNSSSSSNGSDRCATRSHAGTDDNVVAAAAAAEAAARHAATLDCVVEACNNNNTRHAGCDTSPLPTRVCATYNDNSNSNSNDTPAQESNAADATARVSSPAAIHHVNSAHATTATSAATAASVVTTAASNVPHMSLSGATPRSATHDYATATTTTTLHTRLSRSPAPRRGGWASATSPSATAAAAAAAKPPHARGTVVTLHSLAQLEAVLLRRQWCCSRSGGACATSVSTAVDATATTTTTAVTPGESLADVTRRLRPRRLLVPAADAATAARSSAVCDDEHKTASASLTHATAAAVDDDDDACDDGKDAVRATPALLQLRAGETVVLLLHHGERALDDVVSAHTQQLAQMRVYCVNLDTLAPDDYFYAEARVAEATAAAAAAAAQRARAHKDGDGGRHCSSSATALTQTRNTANGGEDVTSSHVDVEEAELIVTPHKRGDGAPQTAMTSSPYHGSGNATTTTAAAATTTTAGCGDASTLSSQLHLAVEHILRYVGMCLRVDLLPCARAETTASSTARPTARSLSRPRDALQPTLMIVWRAGGAPHDEYTPQPPDEHTTVLTPAPLVHHHDDDNDDDDVVAHDNAAATSSRARRYAERMAQMGGVLVVKQVHGVDQLHSLCLWAPVYTVAHLLRTIVATCTAAAGNAASHNNSSSTKTYTVVYLGASWCPPCMRFVATMPQLMHSRLPRSVVCTVKADMDLARPLFDILGVEVIPTFVVLDNEVVCRGMTDDDGRTTGMAVASAKADAEREEAMHALLLRKAELGRLQNSQLAVVATFIEKHCNTLSFDDEF